MSQVKFTKTQEKQYSAWVTLPGVGVRVPGVNMMTDAANSVVICTPLGTRVMPLAELARDFMLKGEKGTEPITQQTLSARAKGGVLLWTEVLRNTAGVHDVMARHLPGKQYNNLGTFEVYPEVMGPQYTMKMRGDAFVRMYNLKGGLANIAMPEQARAVTPKPSVELAKPKVAPVVAAALQKSGVGANTIAQVLETQLRQAADSLRKVNGVSVKLTTVKKEKDGTGKVFYKGDLEYAFPLSTSGKADVGGISVPVAVLETSPNKAAFNLLTRGEGYGVAPASPQRNVVELAGLQTSLVTSIQNRALQIRDAYNSRTSVSKLLNAVESACGALGQRGMQMKHTKFDRSGDCIGYSIASKHKNVLFGEVACVVYESDAGGKVRYHCNFVNTEGDESLAAQALESGAVLKADIKDDTRALTSAILSGFVKLKKEGEKLRATGGKSGKDAFEFRVVGRSRNAAGEQLYVVERIASGAQTSMTRNQLLKILGWDDALLKRTSPNLVENMYARKYQNTTQLRMRGGGGLAEMSVDGIRRSAVNKVEGAKSEATQLYNEIMRALGKKGFTASGEVNISDEEPVGGTFSVDTPDGATITAMYSVSLWRYGATDGGAVKLSGTVPADQRRRSMLASSLVRLILTAAKGSKAGSHKPTAPIVQAQDDDFTDAPTEPNTLDADFDLMEEADGGGDTEVGTFGGDTGENSDASIDPSDMAISGGENEVQDIAETPGVVGTNADVIDADFDALEEVAPQENSQAKELHTVCMTVASIINDKANSVNMNSSVATLTQILDELNSNKDTFDGAFEQFSQLMDATPLVLNDPVFKPMFNEISVGDKANEQNISQVEKWLADAKEVARDLADAEKLYEAASEASNEANEYLEGLDTAQSVVVDEAIGLIAGYRDTIANAAAVASSTFISAGQADKANDLAKLLSNINSIVSQLDTDYQNALAAESDAQVEAQANAKAEADAKAKADADAKAKAAAVKPVEEDEFAGLGDDIDAIFNALPDNRQNQ